MDDTSNLKLKLAIYERGITQRTLSKKVGVTEDWISRIVRGHNRPSPHTRQRIAAALEMTEDSLFD